MGVKILFYNFQYGMGFSQGPLEYMKFWSFIKAPNKTIEEFKKDLIKLNPDVIGLAEIDLGSIRSGKNQVEYLKEDSQFKFSTYENKYGEESKFRKLPIFKEQGNAMISKIKPDEVNFHYLNNGMKRLVIEARFSKLSNISFFITHTALGKRTRQKNLRELAHIIARKSNPVVLMGDLNTFGGLDELKEFLQISGLKTANNGIEIPTYPPKNPKKQLDHILISPKIRSIEIKTIPLEYSDHLPLYAEIEVISWFEKVKNFFT